MLDLYLIMFLCLDKKRKEKVAVVDDYNTSITYGEICDYVKDFNNHVHVRTLTFILAENSIGSLLGYLSMLSNRIVPLVLSRNTDKELYDKLYEMYRPAYLWAPKEMAVSLGGNVEWESWNYALIKTDNISPNLYKDLSLLLPTSGSTGSPKLVRHSYRNIEANAENVVNMFGLTENEKALAVLPMHYTMGLSVITSHLLAGATLLLSSFSLLEKGFWTRLKEATSFTGVPYSYELLMKMRFTHMNLPNLKIITQGGGKLSSEMFQTLAEYARDKGKKFIPTYGQSECTARMAFLPSELTLSKNCSIGFAEPGGQLSIVDSSGNETFQGEATGEMVYRGENVTLGYASCQEDLIKGDENHGIMHTGDLAHRDADGCYFIIGRLKRFLKIFGLRIGLDELEDIIRSEYDNVDCYCKGTDEKLTVLITEPDIAEALPVFIEKKTHLFHGNIEVCVVEKILRNETGKVILQ